MTAENCRINKNVWFYHDETSKSLSVVTLLTCVVLFLATLSCSGAFTVTAIVLALAVAAILSLSKTESVEIDRDKGVVIQTEKYIAFTKRRTHPLRYIRRVTLSAKDAPAEDGYRILRFRHANWREPVSGTVIR